MQMFDPLFRAPQCACMCMYYAILCNIMYVLCKYIGMYVLCMYVCMYVCMHACVYVWHVSMYPELD